MTKEELSELLEKYFRLDAYFDSYEKYIVITSSFDGKFLDSVAVSLYGLVKEED